MNKDEKELLYKSIEDAAEEFWNLDCMIRILKEYLSNDNWDLYENDVYTIGTILAKTSEDLAKQVLCLKEKLGAD